MERSSRRPGHRGLRLLGRFETRFVRAGFRRLLPLGRGVESHLRGVIEDTLANPGSLVRAQLAFGILRRHGVGAMAARSVAIAIEYFHSASLIFDDLPSMDDAAERRGRRCPHLVHGEAAAILGALALVNRGYALVWEVLATLPEERRSRAAELVASCLGVDGILNGQACDLHFASGGRSAEEVRQVAYGKTVSLIRLTLLLPALVAGAGAAEIAALERLATAWGLGYQVLDDFKDGLMSEEETGKSTGRDQELGRPNLPGALGIDHALETLDSLLAESRSLVASFAAGGERWRELEKLQAILEDERRRVRRRLPAAACA